MSKKWNEYTKVLKGPKNRVDRFWNEYRTYNTQNSFENKDLGETNSDTDQSTALPLENDSTAITKRLKTFKTTKTPTYPKSRGYTSMSWNPILFPMQNMPPILSNTKTDDREGEYKRPRFLKELPY